MRLFFQVQFFLFFTAALAFKFLKLSFWTKNYQMTKNEKINAIQIKIVAISISAVALVMHVTSLRQWTIVILVVTAISSSININNRNRSQLVRIISVLPQIILLVVLVIIAKLYISRHRIIQEELVIKIISNRPRSSNCMAVAVKMIILHLIWVIRPHRHISILSICWMSPILTRRIITWTRVIIRQQVGAADRRGKAIKQTRRLNNFKVCFLKEFVRCQKILSMEFFDGWSRRKKISDMWLTRVNEID